MSYLGVHGKRANNLHGDDAFCHKYWGTEITCLENLNFCQTTNWLPVYIFWKKFIKMLNVHCLAKHALQYGDFSMS